MAGLYLARADAPGKVCDYAEIFRALVCDEKKKQREDIGLSLCKET